MAGLHLLKHMDGLSDEAVCARYRVVEERHLRRVTIDIGRKIAGSAATKAAFAGPLGLVARLLRQRREDRGRAKLYALHAPEVECIGKGKAQAHFEFGVKVSPVTTNTVAPGGISSSAPAPCPGTPMTATPWPPRSPRPSGSPASRSSAPMSIGTITATMSTRPASSCPAKSVESRRPSAASGGGATPSSPSSAT